MWLYRLNFGPLGWLLGRYWRLGLVGRVDEIPKDGPILLTANHQSFIDPWLISMAFPRPVRYLITDNWFYRSKTWQFVFESYNGIPVDRTSPGATIDKVCGCLDGGDVVGIFPEGRISYDGKLQPFKTGIARMASRTGAPVVPLGIRGSFHTLPRTKRVPRPVRVTIHVGRPVTYTEATGQKRPSRPGHQEFVEFLRLRTLELTGEHRNAKRGASDSPSPALPSAMPRTGTSDD